MSGSREGPGALYPRLRPKRRGMAPEAVAADQRARLRGALVEAVDRLGFQAVTVRELCGLAGVSTRSFYEHFSSKEACLISAFESIVSSVGERAVAAQRDAADPRERLTLAFEAVTGELVAQPKEARLAFLGILDGGAEALQATRRRAGQVAAVLAAAYEPAADAAIQSSPLVVRGIVGGSVQVSRSRLLDGRVHELPSLAPSLAGWAHARLAGTDDGWADLPKLPPAARSASPPELRPAATGPDAGERTLLLGACAQLAAEGGCATLTAARIAEAAGLPRSAFRRCFESAGDCFTAAYEELCGAALAEALTAAQRADAWEARARHAIATLAIRAARDPVLARVLFGARREGGSAMMAAEARLLADFAVSLHGASAAATPSPLLVEAGVGAAWELLAAAQTRRGGRPASAPPKSRERPGLRQTSSRDAIALAASLAAGDAG